MFKHLLPLILFGTNVFANPYAHLPNKEAQKLLSEARRVCKGIKTYADTESLQALRKIHERHCANTKEPLLTGMLIGIYHLEIDTPEDTQKNKDHKFFYKKQITKLSLLVKRYPDFETPKPIFSVGRNISELSGFTLFKPTNTVWSHGDSGTAAAAAQTQIIDKTTITFQLAGSQNLDWEAITHDATNIWVLDVGDNRAVRKTISFYKLAASDAKNGRVEKVARFDLTYPDGAMDCEAGVYHDGAIYLFQKRYYESSKVYRVPIKDGVPQTPELIGKLPITGPITDATLNDKNQLFVLTYFGVYEVLNWTKPSESKLRVVSTHTWGQTEALVHISGDLFWIGREDGNVFELRDSAKRVNL